MIFRISGSSMLNILIQSHDLSRRIVTKELDKLSFKEYFEIKYNVVFPTYNSIEKIIYEDIPSTNKIKFENLTIFKKLIYFVVASKVPFQVK